MNKYKLSIIIPLYNEENNLDNLIRNLKISTEGLNKNIFEVLFIDAGSNDSTFKLLNSYFSVENYKVIREKRLFPGAARNRGVAIAEGENLLFMDAGIEYQNEFALKLMETLTKGDYDVVWGELVRKSTNEFSKILVDLTYSNNSSKVIPAMLIKKDKFIQLGGFKEDLRALEDTDFIRKINQVGFSQVRVRDAYSYYYDFPKTTFEIYKKWSLYNEYTIYSSLRKNKEKAALIMNFAIIFAFINKKIRKLTIPFLILITFLKFRKKRIKIFNNNHLFKYITISLVIDFATYFGLTKGILKRFWRKYINESN